MKKLLLLTCALGCGAFLLNAQNSPIPSRYYQPFQSVKSLLNHRIKTDLPVASRSAKTKRLDSLVWEEIDLTTKDWTYSAKNFIGYDDRHDAVQFQSFDWESSDSEWSPESQDLFVFDDKHRVLENVSGYWSEATNLYSNYEKIENSYQRDQLDFVLVYDWNPSLEKWDYLVREQHIYDQDGYLTEIYVQEWEEDNNQWQDFLKYTFQNNAEGLPLQGIEWEYDPDEMIWEEWTKFEYTYTPEGLLESQNYSYKAGGEWMISERMEFYYRPDQQLDSLITYSDEQGDFNKYVKREWFYTPDGVLQEMIGYIWDVDLQVWEAAVREGYWYDELLSFEEVLIPTWLEFEFDAPKYFYSYGFVEYKINGTWQEVYRLNFYFSDVSVGVNAVTKKADFEIWPNPASHQVTVELGEIHNWTSYSIADSKGEVIFKGAIQNQNQIALQHLPKGLFVITLQDRNGQASSGKIIVKEH